MDGKKLKEINDKLQKLVCTRSDLFLHPGLARILEDLDHFVDSELCHCGGEVKVHENGFTRGLCKDCDMVRCDAPIYGDPTPACMMP